MHKHCLFKLENHLREMEFYFLREVQSPQTIKMAYGSFGMLTLQKDTMPGIEFGCSLHSSIIKAP